MENKEEIAALDVLLHYGVTSLPVIPLDICKQAGIKVYRNSDVISLQDAFEAKDEINRLKEEIDRLNKEIEDYNQRASEAGDSTDNFAKRADALSDIITYKLVNALEEAGRAAYEAVKSTEDSMTEISRVLELTGSEAENMRSQLFGLGQEFGRSFDDVAASALKFAQSGSNMQESIENTRAMMLALNTAELDVESGTQSLIGIMSQWNMEASDLTTIIDKLNYTADNNAVTTQDLVDGLLKASSMAKTAGISFNDTVGVLTALKESSGAAGKEVGNAFKSILAYIQRPKSLDLFDEMGIEVYADKVTGELLPMMTILENMTNKWNTSQTEMLDTMIKSGDAAQMMSEEWAIATDTMDEYTDYQNAMAEATDKANTAEARAQAQAAAGVYRRNYYISLMENFTKAMEVSKDLVNAEGHSMAENSRYMETLTAKTEQLIAALTELAVTAADAGMLDVAKAAIDTATAFVQWTSESQNLVPVLTSVAGVLITIKAQKIADEFISIGGAFKNAGNAIKTGLTTLSGVQATAQGTTTALNGAAGAASGLSAALGGIGLAVSAISIVVTIINSVTAAIKQAREEEIKAGEAAAETFTTLSKLKAEYEALESVMKRTTEQEERYRTVQDEIVKLLGNRATNLEGLTKGTVEYTESLKSAMKAELEQLEIEQLKAASAAEKELGGGIAYYEDLRRTVAITEEQYKSLESTLSKLYQEQLKQQQEAIKEQYENQKQAIEDRYDDEKEALKKALDDEKDARKEYWSDELDNLKTSLNEQINTAKKVYEQKKKLTEKSHDNQQKSLKALRDSELANIKATYNAQIDALNKIKAARQAERDEEDYQNKRAELLEQISYYEQRTGTDAVEQLESLRKQLAELDRDRQRELEDDNIDNQIDSLEEERDSKTEAVKNSYNQQIEALKTAQEIEVNMYKETYDREVELLKKRLDNETKEMEKRRDRDLKRLEEEQSAKLKALEDEKDAAIKAADTKWKEIQKVFNDSNLALIAAAGQFAPALYEQFHNLFTSKFELDLNHLSALMEELESKKSTFAAQSGVKPTTKAADTSLITTIPSFINKKNMAAAATGGKTLSDGIAMLHKDELVVNAPVTKMLEDILTKISPITKLDAMAIQGNIARYWGEKSIQGYRERTTNIRNSYQNSTNNDSSRSIINNFNAPFQHIEKIEDGADMEAAVNALERDIMRKISTML